MARSAAACVWLAAACLLAATALSHGATTPAPPVSSSAQCARCFSNEPPCSGVCQSCRVEPRTCASCAAAVCEDEGICPQTACGGGCPGIELDGACQCLAGRVCPSVVCALASCPADPTATCMADPCGTCLPVFVSASTALPVNCTLPALPPTCAADADCPPGRVCGAATGCGAAAAANRTCVAPLDAGANCSALSGGACGAAPCLAGLVCSTSASPVCCPDASACSCPPGQRLRQDSAGCAICTQPLGGGGPECAACECEAIPCGSVAAVATNAQGGALPCATTPDCSQPQTYCDAGSGTCCGVKADVCTMPVDVGLCDSPTARFAFSATEHRCVAFNYSGCGGNPNRFQTLGACQEACHPGCPVLQCGMCEAEAVSSTAGSCPVCSTTQCATPTTTTTTTATTITPTTASGTRATSPDPTTTTTTTTASPTETVYTSVVLRLSQITFEQFSPAVLARLVQARLGPLLRSSDEVRATVQEATPSASGQPEPGLLVLVVAPSPPTAASQVRGALQRYVQSRDLSTDLVGAGVATTARLETFPVTSETDPANGGSSGKTGLTPAAIAGVAVVAVVVLIAFGFLVHTWRHRKSVTLHPVSHDDSMSDMPMLTTTARPDTSHIANARQDNSRV